MEKTSLKTAFLLRYGTKIDYLKTNGSFVMSVMEPACEFQYLHLFFLEKSDKIMEALFPATITRRPKLSVEVPFLEDLPNGNTHTKILIRTWGKKPSVSAEEGWGVEKVWKEVLL